MMAMVMRDEDVGMVVTPSSASVTRLFIRPVLCCDIKGHARDERDDTGCHSTISRTPTDPLYQSSPPTPLKRPMDRIYSWAKLNKSKYWPCFIIDHI